jgi:hypothetical protein
LTHNLFWKNRGRSRHIISISAAHNILGAFMIPLTEMKLREAHFFYDLLLQTGLDIVRNTPEAFAFYLNALLSAARAVTFALQYEDKTNYDTWFIP